MDFDIFSASEKEAIDFLKENGDILGVMRKKVLEVYIDWKTSIIHGRILILEKKLNK